MREVGDPEIVSSARSPFGLSPDGTSLAFVISRGDPDSNQICSALVVTPLHGAASPRILDRGGALPFYAGLFRDLYMRSGFPDTVIPLWSADGRYVAYRREIAGVVQLVRARADGTGAVQVTRGKIDVEDFGWSADGAQLIFTARPEQRAARDRIEKAGREGWLLDASVIAMQSWEPQPWGRELPLHTFAVGSGGGQVRNATREEAAAWVAPAATGATYAAQDLAASGARVYAAPLTAHPLALQRLQATYRDGHTVVCAHAGCIGKIARVYWDPSGKTAVFLVRQGWHGEDTVLYRWAPAANRLSAILATRDALTGCIRARNELVCGRENASRPRRIVAIDLSSGAERVIFDPNPQFASLRLGEVRRLRWRNDRGLAAWGDLVLPAGYDGRRKLPLVVVQYRSRGFLRGGTGPDYPIHPLAQNGVAVLSFDRPLSVGSLESGVRDWNDILKIERKDWSERRSVLSSLERGVDAAIATGFIDPARVGISGLSDGASTVEFALINSRRFAVAAMSTCCDDLLGNLVLGGFAWGDDNRRSGYPPSVDDDRAYWRPLSLAINARQINTPILMQLADREALLGLPALGALREAGKPVEAFIYPDEYHLKWQPAHRLVTAQRNIDWFAFWLQDRVDPDPAKAAQYTRWEALRKARDTAIAVTAR